MKISEERKEVEEEAQVTIIEDDSNIPAADSIYHTTSPADYISAGKQRPLTFGEFEYSVGLLNSKIETLYRMCKVVADQQQECLKSLRKLAALDELSDGFWRVFYL